MEMENKKNKKLSKMVTYSAILITSCLILSVVSAPVTIFADEGTEKNINCPSGVTIETDSYNHTYHTKVKITANVTIWDKDGSTTSQKVEKESSFIEGNIPDVDVQSQIDQYNTEIENQFVTKGTITKANTHSSLKFDHFENASSYKLTNAAGNAVFEKYDAE